MRLTDLPVALTVSHGNHGWILTGFRATADPATTTAFTVTSVRVIGPLYGLQSKNGYDMPPNTKLTTAQLRRFFTPWKYAPMPMVWDGRYVSIQPVPVANGADGEGPPRPTPRPSATPHRGAEPDRSRRCPRPVDPGRPAASAGPVAAVVDSPGPTPGSQPSVGQTPAAVARPSIRDGRRRRHGGHRRWRVAGRAGHRPSQAPTVRDGGPTG